MLRMNVVITLVIFLSGCATLNNEVGGYFFPDSVVGKYYVYKGYDESSGLDLYMLKDEMEHRFDHKAILVTLSENRSSDARNIIKVLSEIEFEQKEAKIAIENAERERIAKAKREERERIAKAKREERERIAKAKREERIRQQEAQRLVWQRKEDARLAERRRQIMNMKPVVCDKIITALNANEVRAIRKYPLNNAYRVAGVATDINVTYGDAVVSIKSDVDIFNGCSAEMSSFDDAEVINVGDNIDLFCSSWSETAGNVRFNKCRIYLKVISQ
jgi:hypothetical protein